MKIFISWSGERSRMIAEALRNWLSDVIQALDPWMSSEDIAKGARWSLDLLRELEDTRIGIVCLTPENLVAPWILFEAGAIGKALDKSRVCTYLHGLRPADLEGPLVQFQATVTEENDTLKLLHTVNTALDDNHRLSKDQVERAFEKWWPELKKSFSVVPDVPEPQKPHRRDREILEELLELVRLQISQNSDLSKYSDVASRQMSFSHLFDDFDINSLLSLSKMDSGDRDENATQWAAIGGQTDLDSIEGKWESRWNGGSAYRKWSTGNATVLMSREFVVILFEDKDRSGVPYLIIARKEGQDLLKGRYVNLINLHDSTPWIGKVINNRRIDGEWRRGRWDFRR